MKGGAAARQQLDVPLHRVGAVLERLAPALAPAPACEVALCDAAGAIIAGDVRAGVSAPPCDMAMIDGYALSSADLVGASAMAPAMVIAPPSFVSVGDPMPPGADCVIAPELASPGPVFEVIGAAAPGDGVRRTGEDVAPQTVIAHAGERLDRMRLHALKACGAASVSIRRPRVRVLAVGRPAADPGTAGLIADLAADEGADACVIPVSRRLEDLIGLLAQGAADATFLVGGSGCGPDDHSIAALRACGAALAHGLALEPGRTGAVGLVGAHPVLVFPGRPEAAFAMWLVLGAPVVRALAGAAITPVLSPRPLNRKVSSAVGVAQIAPLEADGSGWRPMAVGDITLSHMARADAFLIVPEESEGYPEGARVSPAPAPGRWKV